MARIEPLAEFVLSWEGGFSNHKNDKGGATNKGVTISTWKAQGYDKDGDGDIDVDDLRLISDQDAIDVVLKPHYWNRWKADQIRSQSVANILVDWVWGSGKYGITEVQKLIGTDVDGIVGKKTLAALNAQDPRTLFTAIKNARARYLKRLIQKDPTQKVFEDGWFKRLNSINYGSLTCNRIKNPVIKFVDV